MRPVNLTPPELRSGSRPPTKTGALPYMLLALLVVLLLGVVALVFTNNEIADADADLQNIQFQREQLASQANELAPYVDFAEVAATRTQTVSSLASSRFDWYRVMQELSLILPEDVWLVNLTATVGPGVSLPNAVQVGNRAEIDSPTMQMIGCGSSQEKVAAFLASMEDIDGVTRVGLVSSTRRDAGTSSDQNQSSDDCRTRGFIWQFAVIASFDAVPAPAGTDVPVAPVEPTTSEDEESSDQSGDDTADSGEDDGSAGE